MSDGRIPRRNENAAFGKAACKQGVIAAVEYAGAARGEGKRFRPSFVRSSQLGREQTDQYFARRIDATGGAGAT